jgi:pyruvate/2-oxoglutarate dehydrogenase complex dihydrolipoamide acyltransferase (E2) component
VEKVTLELEAPASGTLKIKVAPEVVVNKGDVVATIA